jgi:glyoxylase-like metal-dependent hydrolase (beta-lactamase superfamily II)
MAKTALAEWKEADPQNTRLTSQVTEAEGNLPEGVDMFHTPGHTLEHHSLGMNTYAGRLIVAADAVMTNLFYAADDGFHNSADFGLVKESIARIRKEADLIVPGHGNFFVNPDRSK